MDSTQLKFHCSKAEQGRQIGNSMSVNVIQRLLIKILQHTGLAQVDADNLKATDKVLMSSKSPTAEKEELERLIQNMQKEWLATKAKLREQVKELQQEIDVGPRESKPSPPDTLEVPTQGKGVDGEGQPIRQSLRGGEGQPITEPRITLECLGRTSKQKVRKLIVDSGASLHLVNKNKLTKTELKTLRK